MPDETAADVFEPWLAELVRGELATKASLEQRGLAVISTSGGLVTLLAALAVFLLGKDTPAILSRESRLLLVAAAGVFLVSAFLALFTNIPRKYATVSERDLDEVIGDRWWGAKGDALFTVAEQRKKEVVELRQGNQSKGRRLREAIVAEIVGVALVVAAIMFALF